MNITATDIPSVHSETLDQVLRITISNPGKKNAITAAMYEGLAEAISAGNKASVRAIWLRGAGGDFTSGNAIEDFGATALGASSPVVHFFNALLDCRKPVVAEVRGVAIGIGVTMLMHCDLIYADNNARFRLPFVNLGLVPEGGASAILPQIMGHSKAAELLMLGQMFTAEKACSVGLINDVRPAALLEDRVISTLKALCEQPPQALMRTKQMMRQHNEDALRACVAEELAVFAEYLGKAEFKEAYAAFQEKRKPVFR